MTLGEMRQGVVGRNKRRGIQRGVRKGHRLGHGRAKRGRQMQGEIIRGVYAIVIKEFTEGQSGFREEDENVFASLINYKDNIESEESIDEDNDDAQENDKCSLYDDNNWRQDYYILDPISIFFDAIGGNTNNMINGPLSILQL